MSDEYAVVTVQNDYTVDDTGTVRPGRQFKITYDPSKTSDKFHVSLISTDEFKFWHCFSDEDEFYASEWCNPKRTRLLEEGKTTYLETLIKHERPPRGWWGGKRRCRSSRRTKGSYSRKNKRNHKRSYKKRS
jgi:hypothetical protein